MTLNREIRPIPDPSSLTTEQILRENSWTDRLFQAKIDSILATLNGMQTALELVQAKADRQPSPREVQLQVESLISVKQEHWDSVNKQFEAISALSRQASEGNKESLTLALQAQRESAAETKTFMKERIDQMDRQFNTALMVKEEAISALSARQVATDSRVVAIESRTVGQSHEKASQQTGIGALVGIAGLIVAIIVAAMALFNK